LDLNQDFGLWFDQSKRDLDLTAIELTWEVAKELRFTMPGFNDPAARFLVATAKVYDMTLVTADQRLLKVPGLKVLANM
jgi:PIN domain nuclease of toxin-antitoxin system